MPATLQTIQKTLDALRKTVATKGEVQQVRQRMAGLASKKDLEKQKDDILTRVALATKKDLEKQRDDIITRMDMKFETFDRKMDQKLEKLRDDMNKDFIKTVMPLIENHDTRLDRLDRKFGLPEISVRSQLSP